MARSSRELGIFLTPKQLEQFQVYHEELAEWNQRVNLTSVAERQEVQVKHFLDSFTVCLVMPGGLNSSIRVVDVGAGGGFPGLPLKLAFPEIQLSLVESVGKKAAFLEHIVSVLGLSGVELYTGRAESLAHHPELRESFDLAVTRGVAKLSTLAEYTLPFCRTGGKMVALKHGGIEEELDAATHAMEVLGGRMGEVRPVEVSGLTDNRVVVTVEKTGTTPEQYPRRPGMPAKRPL